MAYSQPLSDKTVKRLGLDKKDTSTQPSKNDVQYIGTMYDSLGDYRVTLKDRANWLWRDIKHCYYDVKHTVRSHIKWHKTLCEIRSWEGFDGMLTLMIRHLLDYVETEEKYGNSVQEYKDRKVAAAKETIRILKRLRNHDGYSEYRLKSVRAKYPKYKSLVTKYARGGTGFSGDFVRQGNGWTGTEAGKDPRKGYFEFINGKFKLVPSPNQAETDRLLKQLEDYYQETHEAYERAHRDNAKDFKRLHRLLEAYMYSWWD